LKLVRPLFRASVVALFASASSTAHAVIGADDVVPAATLLVPRFEVEPGVANGKTTIVSFHNARATPVLTNVTVWSDLGVVVEHFPVYLRGYDAVSFDLREVFEVGYPRTVAQDPSYPTCDGVLPLAPRTPANAAALKARLTGKASDGLCYGQDRADGRLRGYLTVDVVRQCGGAAPGTDAYFATDGSGTAAYDNALLGDYFIVDTNRGEAFADAAVHIEASVDSPLTTGTAYTFYGGIAGFDAADRREALPGTWMAPFDGSRGEIWVWRDPKQRVAPFACATKPSFLPLPVEDLGSFDFISDYDNLFARTPPVTGLLGDVLSSVTVGPGGSLSVPFAAGQLYLSTHGSVTGATTVPLADALAGQSYVTTFMKPKAFGSETPIMLGLRATSLDSATRPRHLHTGP
jgi:hypothetical protein